MENVAIISSRKTVVCRYFAASGNCFFGEGCQFLHDSGQTYSNLGSLNSSESNVNNLKSIENKQHFSSLRPITPLVSQEGLSQRTQELLSTNQQQLSGPLNSSTHFEENIGGSNIGGTTYYFSPDENVVPEIEDHTINDHNGHGTTSKPSHNSGKQTISSTSSNNTSQHSFYVYAGPPSFLQNPSGLQRTSFFMNEELRNDLIQRNSVALSTVDVSLFPDLPQEVDHYNELVPLEVHTLNRAVKSQTYGWITSTYKATHINTGLRYCLKRIHGYRVTSAKCMSIIELWRKIQQCHLVTLREVFTTKAFGDHSMIFVYDYFPGAETLMTKHLTSTTSHADPFSSDPSAPRPYSMQKNRMLQQQAGKGMLAESLLWSYIIELCSALRCVHSAGLAVRAMDPSKVLVTSRGRIRLCGGGIFDVLTYDTVNSTYTAMVPHYQQEDLLALGKLILALACNSLLALQRDNVSTSMDIINKNYSSDLRNLIMYLLSSSQGSSRSKNIQEVMPMIGARFFSQLETTSLQADILEDQLARELDNGRLFRLLGKLGTIVDRPEFNMDASWSETGDRYLLKLFRDYVLHPCSEDGRPWIDLAHVIACLNRLETASHDKICLTSRDHQNVLVVSYAELHHCLETSFAELQLAATSAVTAPAHVLGNPSSVE